MLGAIDGKLISSLPLRVSNLNDRWSAFLYDANLKKSRPLGVFENKAWAVIPVRGKVEIFLGHPVTVDNPELFVQVAQTGENSWSIEIHNPTVKNISVTPMLNAKFAPFAGKKLDEGKIEVPAVNPFSLKWIRHKIA